MVSGNLPSDKQEPNSSVRIAGSNAPTKGEPRTYVGRFAPSPTGPLHAGSLVAALASWLDARAAGGTWLVRVEDIDPPREIRGAADDILKTLDCFGLVSDRPVDWQSRRTDRYAEALNRLRGTGLAYPCSCSRRALAAAAARRPDWPVDVYPGTCTTGPSRSRGPFAWRLRVPNGTVEFEDRRAGRVAQHLSREVGDFVIRRRDGLWAYQLAVVVDDAEQGVTDIVRGADLLDNTPRQIGLQRSLRLPTPRYLHVPIVVNERGEKLSKQTGARALVRTDALGELERAWAHLGLAPLRADTRDVFLRRAIELWRERWWPAHTILPP